MLEDLILSRDAPAKRAKYCQEGVEQYFTEGAVMVAFAFQGGLPAPSFRLA